MRSLVTLPFLLIVVAATTFAINPVPFVSQPLIPAVARPGGPAFTLTVHGAAFVKGAVVQWNETKLATQYIGKRTLQATVTADLIATPNTGLITVINPGNKVRSNTALLPVATQRPFQISDIKELETIAPAVDVAMADFDRDGKLDYASTIDSNDFPNLAKNVVIGFNTGEGDIRLSQIALPQRAAGITTGDFNGDGQTDFALVFPDLNVAWVQVFLQRGGFFRSVSTTRAGILPQYVTSGDFNRDGKLDLAVTDRDAQRIVVLLGNGDGTLTAVQTLSTIDTPVRILEEDFNGDGFLDLATPTGAGHISVALGLGDGSFAPVTVYATGQAPNTAVSADFNQDAVPDLAVPTYDGMSILLGNGDGTFQPEKRYSIGRSPWGATFGDFDADGYLDLVAATEDGISYLRGNGDGTFQKNVMAGTDLLYGASATGDFNLDGRLDIVVDELAGAISIVSQ